MQWKRLFFWGLFVFWQMISNVFVFMLCFLRFINEFIGTLIKCYWVRKWPFDICPHSTDTVAKHSFPFCLGQSHSFPVLTWLRFSSSSLPPPSKYFFLKVGPLSNISFGTKMCMLIRIRTLIFLAIISVNEMLWLNSVFYRVID